MVRRWSNPTPAAPDSGPKRKDFWFGDPRRPRSLVLALFLTAITFPVIWFGLLILWALGATATDEEITHAARVILLIAASVSALAMVAASFAWLDARRSYPPEARVAPSGREVALSASAILLVLGAAVAGGVLLWHFI